MDTSIGRCIAKLCAGESLQAGEISESMSQIMEGSATDAQIGAFMVALDVKSITADVLAECADTMKKYSLPCKLKSDHVLDIVGTGGDGWDTFNVSTAASIIVAASGITVAKHGNRSSSGRCGSADIIEGLGGNLEMDNDKVASAIDSVGFGFLFAQKFHPAMKNVAPVRKQLGIRSVFNILGPLTNPANPQYMLVGVPNEILGNVYAEVLRRRPEIKRAMIVHARDGLDEISVQGETYSWLVSKGEIIRETLSPERSFGIKEHPIQSVLGRDPMENVKRLEEVMDGKKGPITDFCLLNAAAALVLTEKAKSYKEGVDVARSALASGNVKTLVRSYVAATTGANS